VIRMRNQRILRLLLRRTVVYSGASFSGCCRDDDASKAKGKSKDYYDGDHHDGENHHFYLRCSSDSREQQDEQGWTGQYAINKSIDSATPSNLHHIGITEIK
jgi:hypothetical protein